MSVVGFILSPTIFPLNAIQLREWPGLQSITFYEQTTDLYEYTFSVSSSQLLNRLPILGPGLYDYRGTSNEYYDVFYSDEFGSFGIDGECITIECMYDGPSSAHNTNGVKLNFEGGTSRYAIYVTEYRVLGNTGNPNSVPNAVDGDLQTWTSLGTAVNQNERLSLTLAFPIGPFPQSELFQGNQSDISGTDADPVNTATGSFFHQQTDMSITGRGSPLIFKRYYNSKAAASVRNSQKSDKWRRMNRHLSESPTNTINKDNKEKR
jgi:hypothetical protein